MHLMEVICIGSGQIQFSSKQTALSINDTVMPLCVHELPKNVQALFLSVMEKKTLETCIS